VLHANRSVNANHQRLAFDLEITMRHADRRFFVAACDELGILVAAVVDEGLVQAAERIAGIRAQIFEADGLEGVDHEVRAWMIDRNRLYIGIGQGCGCGRFHLGFSRHRRQRRRRIAWRGNWLWRGDCVSRRGRPGD
jgi:hypothetical protein